MNKIINIYSFIYSPKKFIEKHSDNSITQTGLRVGLTYIISWLLFIIINYSIIYFFEDDKKAKYGYLMILLFGVMMSSLFFLLFNTIYFKILTYIFDNNTEIKIIFKSLLLPFLCLPIVIFYNPGFFLTPVYFFILLFLSLKINLDLSYIKVIIYLLPITILILIFITQGA